MPSVVWFTLNAWIPTVGPGITFLYIMKTSTISSTKNPSTTTSEPAVTDCSSKVEPTDDMVARYSWYYEEKETEKEDEVVENESITRTSYISMITRGLSLKDNLLYRESNAV